MGSAKNGVHVPFRSPSRPTEDPNGPILKADPGYGILSLMMKHTGGVRVKLYHGSTVPVERPEIRTGAVYLDFGVGFYTTTSYEQALRWAKIKMRREQVPVGYVSVYDFDLETASGVSAGEPADMHIGPVADDNVYQAIRFFETGIFSAEETVKRLKTEVLHDQWTFHTARALSYCRFVDYREVR